jgi:hypothetical protein
MSASLEDDPIRATLLAILKQLNQAESQQDGATPAPALELAELEDRLKSFWAIDSGTVTVSLALGLLLRNGLVGTRADQEYSWQRGRAVAQRYNITGDGKKFLVDSIGKSDRIG